MPDFLRILAPREEPVLSLEVRARMAPATVRKKTQFELLLRHFLHSFFNNEMVSSDGEAKAHTLQVAYAIALPGLVFALFLFPPYHFPAGRPDWLEVSDRYFYVMYSLVAVGVGTMFEWDLFFPNVVDVFVFAGLPATKRNLFAARMAAVGVFLGSFIVGTNLLGIVFFPSVCDLASPLRHFMAHFAAVTMSGMFAASLFLAVQALLLSLLGDRMLRLVAPLVQGVGVALLFIVLLAFPTLSRLLPALLQSDGAAVQWFPPFWFLGIYERLLEGPGTRPVFAALARTGVLATLGAMGAAVLLYPLAYWRRTRQLVEGQATRSADRRWRGLFDGLLHATLLRVPQERAIHHFITQTLLRTQRQRVYLAIYGGLGVALVVSSALLMRMRAGRMELGLSEEGLRAALPILIFWVIAGLRASFLSPVDQRASWVFRVIGGRPSLAQMRAARRWVLLWALALAVCLAAGVDVAGQEAARTSLETAGAMAGPGMVAAGLCLLLRDAFFLQVKTIPFTGLRSADKTNLAIILIQYCGLFPPLVLVTVGVEAWMQMSVRNLAITGLLAAALHFGLESVHRTVVGRNANLLEIDGDEDEFPQRLGLRY